MTSITSRNASRLQLCVLKHKTKFVFLLSHYLAVLVCSFSPCVIKPDTNLMVLRSYLIFEDTFHIVLLEFMIFISQELADIIPRDTLLWKLKLLKTGAAYANSRLHAVQAEVLLLARFLLYYFCIYSVVL